MVYVCVLFFLVEDRKISSENPGNGSAEEKVKLSTADGKEETSEQGIVEKMGLGRRGSQKLWSTSRLKINSYGPSCNWLDYLFNQ